MRLLISWAISALAIAIAAAVLPGITIDGGITAYFFIAIVLATVNLFLGGLLKLLTFPLILLTLGIFALVLNALMILVTDWLMDSLDVDGFWPAFWGALLISIVTVVLRAVLLRPKESV
ncbi:MAG TPA: phage holin family protein [Acidimicrobiales bacterium]|jgi:putative membrane protein